MSLNGLPISPCYFNINPENGQMTFPTYNAILLDQIATSVLNAQIQSIDGLYTLFDSEGTPEALVQQAGAKRQQEREDLAKMSYLMAAEMMKARSAHWESQKVEEKDISEKKEAEELAKYDEKRARVIKEMTDPQLPELNPEALETIKKAHEVREL